MGSDDGHREIVSAKVREETAASQVARDVRNMLIWDIVVPEVRKALFGMLDLFCDAIKRSAREAFGLEAQRTPDDRVIRRNGRSYVSYDMIHGDSRRSRRDRTDRHAATRRRGRRAYSFDDIVFDTREDAESVIERLVDLTVEFGEATVSDLLDLVGETGTWADDDNGWEELGKARVVRIDRGWILDLPRPYSLRD